MFISVATQLVLQRRIPKRETKTSFFEAQLNTTELYFLFQLNCVFAHDGQLKYNMPVGPGKDFSQEELLQPGKYTGTNDM